MDYNGLLGVEFTNAVQPGFSKQTNVVASANNGLSYLASISNPLPGGIQAPLGASGGLTTLLGGSPGFLLEVGYLGSKSVDLRVTRQFNSVPKQYLSTFPTRIASVRVDGQNVTNFSVHKLFPLRERLKLELRGDAEGITNHPNFAAPNNNPTSSLFGQVTTTQTNQEERRIFVGRKAIL